MSQKVNLNAYFERIGFAGSIAPTLATLELIHALHPAAIPFENLNPLLGLPVNLDLASIEKKLLTEKRGGYCYEHNLLLMAVLRELDFSVRGLAARVLWSDPSAVDRPPTHMLLAVEIGGATYIADVGFGGLTLTAPLKLKSETEQATPHETFRLTGGAPDWTLEAKIGEAWKALYIFDTVERTLEDYAASNLILSTDSPFTRELRVALSPSGQRLALRNNRFTTHTVGEPSESRLLTSLAEMREVLSGPFGIQLPSAELLDPKLEEILAAAGTEA
ncbi:arylamine N-acetyltransferase family protein [Devosia ginsengisoli]|uniref:Arylamine N-acetyltransferase n=1 Tax=Devosia ginsengisoli TaxID=400770 RepID=A0A5B8LWY4_9HYPH|nr:arylamine N-acetyltransferase [Devosia ginsengisoli]QDZ12341.1 arylamine N-acetyltransferase [Devosia ginsengisoli]